MTTSVREVRFWDRIADRYAARPVPDEDIYQRKLQLTRQRLRGDMKLLEFGCGTGSTALTHAPHVEHIRAIDLSTRMIEIARDKAAAQGVDNVSFERSSFGDFDAQAESFDMILGLSILHLVDDRDAALAKAFRLLAPGGLLVTSTPCIGDTMPLFKLIGPVGRFLRLMPMVRVFRKKDLLASMKAAGFVIDENWQPARKKAVFLIARKPRGA